MTRALFAGSFDPFTLGHLDTVERAARLFDKLYVAVATNSSKKSLFTAQEKLTLIEDACAYLDNVEVINHTDGLTIDLARKVEANVLIRGVRSVKDYEYEADIAAINRHQDNDIETLLLLATQEYSFVSSSMIKETTKYGGNIKGLVPANVEKALYAKFRK